MRGQSSCSCTHRVPRSRNEGGGFAGRRRRWEDRAVTDTVNAAATDIEFLSAYDQGFARVAAVTLPVVPVDPAANAAAIIDQALSLIHI